MVALFVGYRSTGLLPDLVLQNGARNFVNKRKRERERETEGRLCVVFLHSTFLKTAHLCLVRAIAKAISACEKSGMWLFAIVVFSAYSVLPDVISHAAA